jgi:hypothetical protein
MFVHTSLVIITGTGDVEVFSCARVSCAVRLPLRPHRENNLFSVDVILELVKLLKSLEGNHIAGRNLHFITSLWQTKMTALPKHEYSGVEQTWVCEYTVEPIHGMRLLTFVAFVVMKSRSLAG